MFWSCQSCLGSLGGRWILREKYETRGHFASISPQLCTVQAGVRANCIVVDVTEVMHGEVDG